MLSETGKHGVIPLRVGVISDTHGAVKETARAVQQMGNIDALIHAGDFYVDALFLKSELKVPVYAVAGNCDSPSSGPDELTITLDGHRVLITHGHLHRVKYGLQGLVYKAREVEATTVVFGHTHVPLNLMENNILLFNPGSPVNPMPGHIAGYGILEIDKQRIKGRLLSL
ncbi:MAG TPA: metallophosphoesterase [Desulfotomaculum sp.]|nr:metallophosphoesterase [Desulfotomaculum sp.]